MYCSIWRKIHGFGGSAAADHHRVAAGLRNHGGSVFRRAHIAVADDGNCHRVLHRGNPLPVRLSAVALLAGASVQGDRSQPAVLGHLREVDVDNFLVAPAGAELHREWYGHGRAHRLEDVADERQVAQQSRAAIALHDLLCRTAQVQIDHVEAQVLDHARRVRQRRGIAAEQLRRDGMFVAVET